MKKFKFNCEIIIEADNSEDAKKILHNDITDMTINSDHFCMCNDFVLEDKK